MGSGSNPPPEVARPPFSVSVYAVRPSALARMTYVPSSGSRTSSRELVPLPPSSSRAISWNDPRRRVPRYRYVSNDLDSMVTITVSPRRPANTHAS
jgi:hypothetical protein